MASTTIQLQIEPLSLRAGTKYNVETIDSGGAYSSVAASTVTHTNEFNWSEALQGKDNRGRHSYHDQSVSAGIREWV